jgi:putative glutamine amidotransferase
MGPLAAHAVAVGYVDGVRRTGALPLILPILPPEDVPDLLDMVDGLVITGGGDLDPSSYGAERHAETGESDAARDAFDLALIAQALERDTPVLAICRGAQALNVALGGTLLQHLPEHTGSDHGVYDRHTERVHRVRIDPGSRLASVVGATEVFVNSLHHQAVDEPGEGLVAVAWSDDGAIEAVESGDDGGPFGVQWHPELLGTEPDAAALFAWVAERSRAAVQAR